MNVDALNNPLVASLNRIATQAALDVLQQQGKALPCTVTAVSENGAIVTVNFEVTGYPTLPKVTMAVLTNRYFRAPISVGDKGVSMPADTYTGAMTGLGTGTANLAQPQGNLAALHFVPLGNKSWAALPSGMAVVTGPEGVMIMDDANDVSIVVTTNAVTITSGGTVKVTAQSVTLDTPEVVVTTLPTSAGATGQLWNSGGTVKVS